MKKTENLVDEGFRVSLVETAFFDGIFEIPHIDGPSEIRIPSGMIPFSLRICAAFFISIFISPSCCGTIPINIVVLC